VSQNEPEQEAERHKPKGDDPNYENRLQVADFDFLESRFCNHRFHRSESEGRGRRFIGIRFKMNHYQLTAVN
jgi:hypothetical protein